jgi:UDP-2,4-diacetamido-2,4,6-trideoxy-beta-L-altropyranose hydrolase
MFKCILIFIHLFIGTHSFADGNILFRVDSGGIIGSGHLVRCLVLAETLREEGYTIWFASRNHAGNLLEKIKLENFPLIQLPPPTLPITSDSSQWLGESVETDIQQTFGTDFYDLVIIDHYSIDESWEKLARKHTKSIIVIDDLANRKHDCDLLIDQSYFPNFQKRYTHLVNLGATQLLGPDYALIHPRFKKMRDISTYEDKNRLVVTFGGTDPTHETMKVLGALSEIYSLFSEILVIVGAGNPQSILIKEATNKIPNAQYIFNTPKIPELFASSKLAIMAGGTMTWERACLGIPAIVISVAENQREMAEILGLNNYQIYLGSSQDVSQQDIISVLKETIADNTKLEQLRIQSLSLVDGLGLQRITTSINKLN